MRKKIFLLFAAIAVGSGVGFLVKPAYKPKVYDCFPFYDEFDLLDVRLHELQDKVEKFVLIEATRTYQNKPKPLYFAENKERYAKFKDKIVHFVVDKFPEFGPVSTDKDWWELENFQRDRLRIALRACRPNKRDIVLFTDCDEIVRREKIDEIVKLIDQEKNDLVFGTFTPYAYFLNRQGKEPWCLCIATSYGTFSKYIVSGQDLKNLSGFSRGHAGCGFRVLDKIKQKHPNKKWAFANTHDTGWHFTSLGGHKAILQKLDSQAHILNNTEEARRFEFSKQMLNNYQLCQIDDTYPHYIIDHKQEFREKGLVDEDITIFH